MTYLLSTQTVQSLGHVIVHMLHRSLCSGRWGRRSRLPVCDELLSISNQTNLACQSVGRYRLVCGVTFLVSFLGKEVHALVVVA